MTPAEQSLRAAEICRLAPVVPVLVIDDISQAVALAQALVAGGLPVLEVTLRTPVALQAIRLMAQLHAATATPVELSQVLLCQDIIQFAALVPNKKKEAQSEKDNSMKVGSRGCTVAQVREAQRECCNALINRGSGDLRQNNVRSVLAGRESKVRSFKPAPYRWGSLLGLQSDGLTVVQPNGKRVRIPRPIAQRLLLGTFVQRVLYGGLRRPKVRHMS
jgi:hypothetical protein